MGVVNFLSWVLVSCLALYVFGITAMVFIFPPLIPFIAGGAIIAAIISGALLLILLIRERLKDKEAEKNDLDKY